MQRYDDRPFLGGTGGEVILLVVLLLAQLLEGTTQGLL